MKETDEREKMMKLFMPFENKIFPVRNRFVRAATWLAACRGDGRATSASISLQVEAAAGGAGTVISEFAYISPEGRALDKQWGIDDDDALPEVRALADAIHGAGSKLIVQICHAGCAAEAKEGARPYSPSGGRCPGNDSETAAMTREDIKKVCRDFAAAAKRAMDGGADGVEIHGAHGFLLSQFMSPLINKRTDEYGGSFENRLRAMREVYSAVRGAVGEGFSVWLKLSAVEGAEGGYGAEEGIGAALTLLADGVDVLEVSSGTGYSKPQHAPSVVGVSSGESEAPFAKYAAEIRSKAPKNSLVLLTGGLRSLPVIAALLDDGTADLFGMSRPFIAEPDLINRWAEDDARPSACVSCNACFRTSEYGAIDCPIMRDRQEGDWDPL